MLRAALAGTAVILVAWLALAVAIVHGADEWAGVELLFLTLWAFLGLVVMWIGFGLAFVFGSASRAAKELASGLPPDES